VVENRSEGGIDDFGLAPVSFYEKRLRKEPYTTSFKRDGKTIAFTESDVTYPILGGEQDRSSAQWQLAALARLVDARLLRHQRLDDFPARARSCRCFGGSSSWLTTIR